MSNFVNFGRYCQITIGASDDESALDVSGLKIQFEIVKSSIGAPNTAVIKIYNLSESSRGKISQSFDRVIVDAGYENSHGTIFSGEIFNIFHRRVQPDWITEIYASDAGFNFREAYTNESYGNGISLGSILDGLAIDLDADVGQINVDTSQTKLGGWNFTGDTSKALDQLAKDYNFKWSVQTGKLYVIGDGLTADARPKFEITSESGMIGSPVLTETGAHVKTLLNWQIIPNEEISIISVGATINYAYLNIVSAKERINYGDFIARKITHTGDTRGAPWYTEIEAYDAPSAGG